MKILTKNQVMDPILAFNNVKMSFLGAISFQDILYPEIKDLVRYMNNANVNQWIITSDSKKESLSAGYHVGILTEASEFISINESEVESLNLQIKGIVLFIRKQILKYDQDQLDKEKSNEETPAKEENHKILSNSVLLMDGSSIGAISESVYLRTHLSFIVFLMRNVIVYSCNSEDKKKFI